MGFTSSKPGSGSAGGLAVIHDGVADLGVGDGLDIGEDDSRLRRPRVPRQGIGLGDW